MFYWYHRPNLFAEERTDVLDLTVLHWDESIATEKTLRVCFGNQIMKIYFGNLSPKDEDIMILQCCGLLFFIIICDVKRGLNLNKINKSFGFLTVWHTKSQTKKVVDKHDLPTTFEIQLKAVS